MDVKSRLWRGQRTTLVVHLHRAIILCLIIECSREISHLDAEEEVEEELKNETSCYVELWNGDWGSLDHHLFSLSLYLPVVPFETHIMRRYPLFWNTSNRQAGTRQAGVGTAILHSIPLWIVFDYNVAGWIYCLLLPKGVSFVGFNSSLDMISWIRNRRFLALESNARVGHPCGILMRLNRPEW